MLLGWQSQISLGILHATWPQVIQQARCQKVQHEEKDKKKQKADFPIDEKYQKVRDLQEYQDVFHDELDETDRLCEGLLDFKLKPGMEAYQTNIVQKVNYHKMTGCMQALRSHLTGGLLVEHDDKLHGPLNWLFYGQFVEKPNAPGTFRIVGDFKPFNDRIQKDFYDIMTPDGIWKKVLPNSDLYFVCDAKFETPRTRCV